MNITHEITAYGRGANGRIGNYTVSVHAPNSDEATLLGVFDAKATDAGFRPIAEPVVTAL